MKAHCGLRRYWGWSDGLYMFHPGYWGMHVGYYGGVNYGFGYMGIGFVGGEWRGREFAYNTAVVNVNRTVIRNTYVERDDRGKNTIVNDRHVAYAGGPGGIRHDPTCRRARSDARIAPGADLVSSSSISRPLGRIMPTTSMPTTGIRRT